MTATKSRYTSNVFPEKTGSFMGSATLLACRNSVNSCVNFSREMNGFSVDGEAEPVESGLGESSIGGCFSLCGIVAV